ncbi:MAG: gamma-glutamyl-gamma-aminobutyrate hydrolase family protein [Lachnospiraceae bacterium]|nr:gamma-glutamyl-gamma-aminobutyrate hydrolase family protein [Lachnospiraceae bacterium]
MKKPVIGITMSSDEKENKINHAYASAVMRAGGLPVLLPTVEGTTNIRMSDVYVEEVDGILFSGGTDIHPVYFGEFLQDGYAMPYELSPVRDKFEIELYRSADAKGLPMLGICRGIQLMAVAAGGSIFQDIDMCMMRQLRIRHSQNAPADTLVHPVIIENRTRLGAIMGKTTAWVNSMHHQAVKVVPDGYRVSATSPDGIIEAMEMISNTRFALGVQWHPERLFDSAEANCNRKIFERFIEAAQRWSRR